MNATQLLAHFDRLAEAPNAVPRLRRFILDLAVRGKLVAQDARDEPAAVLLKKVSSEWARLQKSGVGKKGKNVSDLVAEDGPFALPSLWAFVCLGEVLQMFNGRAFKPTEWQATGLPIVRIQNLNNPNAGFNYCDPLTVDERHLIRDGEFLISWSGTPGTSFGAFIWQRGEGALNQHIFRCVQVGMAFEPRFLRLAINTQLDVLISQAQGGVGLQHVTKGTLEKLPLALPPFAEQHRIVAKVDELMALCDRLEAAQQERERRRDRLAAASLQRLNQSAADTTSEAQREHARFHLHHLPRLTTRPEYIKAMRQAFFNLAICGKLVDQKSDDEPVGKLLKQLGVQAQKAPIEPSSPTIPATWAWLTIEQIANVSSGTTPSRDVAEYYSPDGTPWVTSGETSNTFITETAQHVSDRALKETSLKLYPPGTLIVAMYGQGKTRGQVAELSIAATTNQACAAIVLKLENVGHRRFVKLFFQKIYEEIRELAAGGAQPNLNGGKIKATLIPFPPLAEQHRVVTKVDELMTLCDQLEAQLTTTQTDSRRLLEAVLEAALAPA